MREIKDSIYQVGPIRVHTIPTKKFKTNTLVLYMRAPLEEETVTKRAILPHILQSATTNLRSRKEIRERLAKLYGANFSVDVLKKGENHVLTFQIDVANEKYLKDSEPLFSEAVQLLSQVVLQPLTEDGAFAKKIVEAEKRSLKQRIQSIYDDKIRYANSRIVQEMCKDEPYGILVYGREEAIDELTSFQLFEYYKQALASDEIDLYLIGDFEEQTVIEQINEHFQFPGTNRKITHETASVLPNEVKEHVVFEEQDINQGKLHIGYRAFTTFADEDYYALQVFNGIFGGFSHSKLFMNVREKNSLAYYVASRYESHKGLIMIMAGIEFDKYEQALQIIHAQMDEMKAGQFDDEAISQTKEMLKNQLLETVDTARGTVELLYHNVISDHKRLLTEWIEGIEKVTHEDIVAVANKIKLDTIYFLKGKEGEVE